MIRALSTLYVIASCQLGLVANIDFKNYTVEQALAVAKQQNKWVFIDAYALWCAPCKEMDKVFSLAEVGLAFNADYISIKVDMDSPAGELLASAYDVVWLPTMIILDEDGQIRHKVDRQLQTEELIELAKSVKRSSAQVYKSDLSKSPFPQDRPDLPQSNTPIEATEEVVYVYDERSSSGRPHIMYHEAYLHLQLMDGKHEAVVKKYLSTQEDWTIEKNIRFIFDFLHRIDSPLFQYVVDNREAFENILGQERVDQSLSILIYQYLEKGYPRPTLERAKTLLSHIYKDAGDQKAYQYYLDQLHRERDWIKYVELAQEYFVALGVPDLRHAQHFAQYLLINQSTYQQLRLAEQWLSISIDDDDDDRPVELATLAEVYFLMGHQEAAKKYIQLAKRLIAPNHIYASSISSLFEKIHQEK